MSIHISDLQRLSFWNNSLAVWIVDNTGNTTEEFYIVSMHSREFLPLFSFLFSFPLSFCRTNLENNSFSSKFVQVYKGHQCCIMGKVATCDSSISYVHQFKFWLLHLQTSSLPMARKTQYRMPQVFGPIIPVFCFWICPGPPALADAAMSLVEE